jgi:hypothetical protein
MSMERKTDEKIEFKEVINHAVNGCDIQNGR